MRVLISGAGIAGPALAYWLAQYGYEATIVEKSPVLRTGGYIIDFWGAGFDVAERMGLLPELREAGYVVQDVRVLNNQGKVIAGFPARVFERATQGRYLSLPRGDLAASIFHCMANQVETIFGDSVEGLEQSADSVQVWFESGMKRTFDLVVGADGLHSRVRELAFGPEEKFEQYLGYKAAAFESKGYRPRDELSYVMHTQVGRQITRFSMRDDCTVFLFTFADDDPTLPSSQEEQKQVLHRRFGSSGWECPRILRALDQVNSIYFDRVSQIRMAPQEGSWTRGRVTLLGDAAFCVSLLAGQGTALAMVAAYILAGELHRANGDYASACIRYQQLFGPFVLRKQKAALRFAGSFAPKSKLSLILRNGAMNLFRFPFLADLTLGRDLADRLALPCY